MIILSPPSSEDSDVSLSSISSYSAYPLFSLSLSSDLSELYSSVTFLIVLFRENNKILSIFKKLTKFYSFYEKTIKIPKILLKLYSTQKVKNLVKKNNNLDTM